MNTQESTMKEKQAGPDTNEAPAQESAGQPSVAELTTTLKQVQADFENYRKQTEKRLDDMRKFAAKGLIMDLLPTIDHFKLAMQHTDNPEEFKKGMEMIYQHFLETLKSIGVEPINTSGTFNQEYHEAISQEESDTPDQTILAEVQQGYTMHGKVLRAAKVKISKGPAK